MMQTYIQGIPCQVRVDTLSVVKPHPLADNPDDFFGYTEIEYTVFDRKGYPARWLEDKMTDEDRHRIEQEIIDESKSYEEY